MNCNNRMTKPLTVKVLALLMALVVMTEGKNETSTDGTVFRVLETVSMAGVGLPLLTLEDVPVAFGIAAVSVAPELLAPPTELGMLDV